MRILVIGDKAKTKLVTAFVNQNLSDEYRPLIIDDISVDVDLDEVRHQVRIVDMTNVEEYDRLRPTYYNNADAIIFAYANTSSDNTTLLTALEEVNHFCPSVPKLLVKLTDPKQENLNFPKQKKSNKALQKLASYECDLTQLEQINAVFHAAIRQVCPPVVKQPTAPTPIAVGAPTVVRQQHTDKKLTGKDVLQLQASDVEKIVNCKNEIFNALSAIENTEAAIQVKTCLEALNKIDLQDEQAGLFVFPLFKSVMELEKALTKKELKEIGKIYFQLKILFEEMLSEQAVNVLTMSDKEKQKFEEVMKMTNPESQINSSSALFSFNGFKKWLSSQEKEKPGKELSDMSRRNNNNNGK